MNRLPTFRLSTDQSRLRYLSRLFIAFAALVGIFAARLSAQSASPPAQTGGITIAGTVRNAAGEPVAGAHVRLEEKNQPHPLETKTNADGTFVFALARAGTFTLRAEKSGWRDAVTEAFSLFPSETKKIDLILQILNP